MKRYRRRVPRQEAGWPGKCRLDDDLSVGWAECLVLDISVIGVGVEVSGPLPSDLVGRRIEIEVHPPVGSSVAIHMVAQVRNTTPGRTGGVRIGMEFVDLSDTERSILDALEMMRVPF